MSDYFWTGDGVLTQGVGKPDIGYGQKLPADVVNDKEKIARLIKAGKVSTNAPIQLSAVEEVDSRVALLTEQLAAANSQVDAMTEQLAAVNSQVDAMTEQLAAANITIENQNKSITALTDQLTKGGKNAKG